MSGEIVFQKAGFSAPEPLLVEVRGLAKKTHQTFSGFVTECLRERVEAEKKALTVNELVCEAIQMGIDVPGLIADELSKLNEAKGAAV